MTTQTYATVPTQYFLNAIAAEAAGGDKITIMGGTLIVGDGNGVVPSLSSLVAANGVLHEVWRGQTIMFVAVDANSASQIDIGVEIPASIGGVEVGPFTVREFALLDVTGHCIIVGTTNLEKTTSAQGQVSDLVWTIAIGVGVGAVVLQPPSGNYVTMAQVAAAYNSNLPDCTAPLTKTDTAQPNGWLKRVFGIVTANQANLGSGRAATDNEFGNGAPASGSNTPFPWPTLQQIKAALNAIGVWAAGQFVPIAGGTMTGRLILSADPTNALGAVTKQYSDALRARVTNVVSSGQSIENWVQTQANAFSVSDRSNSTDITVNANSLVINKAGSYQINVKCTFNYTVSFAQNVAMSALMSVGGVVARGANSGFYTSVANTLVHSISFSASGRYNSGDVLTFSAQLGAASTSNTFAITADIICLP